MTKTKPNKTSQTPCGYVEVVFPLNDYWQLVERAVNEAVGRISNESHAGPFGKSGRSRGAKRTLLFHVRRKADAASIQGKVDALKLPKVSTKFLLRKV